MNEAILDLQAELNELAAIEAESIGWLPLCDGAYMHVGIRRAMSSAWSVCRMLLWRG